MTQKILSLSLFQFIHPCTVKSYLCFGKHFLMVLAQDIRNAFISLTSNFALPFIKGCHSSNKQTLLIPFLIGKMITGFPISRKQSIAYLFQKAS